MKALAVILIAVILGGSPGIARAYTYCTDPYVVQPGETLVSIAEKCGISSYLVLMGINYELSDPNLLRPGQVIRLTAEEPLPQYHPTASGPAQPGGLQEGGVYIVRKGDSLARIAYLYDTSVAELLDANPQLGGSTRIFIGQHIQLPPDAKLSKGWVGVSNLNVLSGDTIGVRLVDFPPYARVTFDLMRQGAVYVYDTLNARTDARGQAWVEVEIPTYTYYGDKWVVKVETTDQQQVVFAESPVMVTVRPSFFTSP